MSFFTNNWLLVLINFLENVSKTLWIIYFLHNFGDINSLAWHVKKLYYSLIFDDCWTGILQKFLLETGLYQHEKIKNDCVIRISFFILYNCKIIRLHFPISKKFDVENQLILGYDSTKPFVRKLLMTSFVDSKGSQLYIEIGLRVEWVVSLESREQIRGARNFCLKRKDMKGWF